VSDLKGVAILAMQAMLSSRYKGEYAEDGKKGHTGLSEYEAIAKEAFKYAKALEKEFEEDYRK